MGGYVSVSYTKSKKLYDQLLLTSSQTYNSMLSLATSTCKALTCSTRLAITVVALNVRCSCCASNFDNAAYLFHPLRDLAKWCQAARRYVHIKNGFHRVQLSI